MLFRSEDRGQRSRCPWSRSSRVARPLKVALLDHAELPLTQRDQAGRAHHADTGAIERCRNAADGLVLVIRREKTLEASGTHLGISCRQAGRMAIGRRRRRRMSAAREDDEQQDSPRWEKTSPT